MWPQVAGLILLRCSTTRTHITGTTGLGQHYWDKAVLVAQAKCPGISEMSGGHFSPLNISVQAGCLVSKECSSLGRALYLQGCLRKVRKSGCCSIGFLFSFSHVVRLPLESQKLEDELSYPSSQVWCLLVRGQAVQGAAQPRVLGTTEDALETLPRTITETAAQSAPCRNSGLASRVWAPCLEWPHAGFNPLLSVLKPLMISEQGAPHFI